MKRLIALFAVYMLLIQQGFFTEDFQQRLSHWAKDKLAYVTLADNFIFKSNQETPSQNGKILLLSDPNLSDAHRKWKERQHDADPKTDLTYKAVKCCRYNEIIQNGRTPDCMADMFADEGIIPVCMTDNLSGYRNSCKHQQATCKIRCLRLR